MPGQNDARGTLWVVIQFALMLAVLVLAPAWRSGWGNGFTIALGIGLLALGAYTGIKGDRDLGRQRTPFPQPMDDGVLVTHGIYAHVRHPLYVAVVALSFAWALLWASTAALLVAVVSAVFLDLKARNEEQRLVARFAGYAEYARHVKRFVPGIY